jgi:hypothetical protein
VNLNSSRGTPVGEALAVTLLPALAPLGFRLVSVSENGAEFDGSLVRFEARYVSEDGDLAVHVIPHDTGERLQLLMYLRAIRSTAASKLGDAVAESADDALRNARTYAASLPDVTKLLAGDPAELDRARDLRWWNVGR